jgi:hypothetical protein
VIASFYRAIFKGLFLLVILLSLTLNQPFIKDRINTNLNFEHNDNLQAEADALLHLFDNMPKVPVFIRDEPILKSGTNTERGAAFTHCTPQQFPTVFIKKVFYQKANQKQLINALKHELTHAWLCRQGLMSVGHNEIFRQKFSEVGGFGN